MSNPRYESSESSCFFEGQPRVAREHRLWLPMAEAADEIRLDACARKKFAIYALIVEARHGPAIQSEGARGHNEVGTLQGPVTHCRHFCESRLLGPLPHHFAPSRKQFRHRFGKVEVMTNDHG